MKQRVVSLISLGCPKNQVDSEVILGQLVEAGFLIAEDPARADLCLVNTCGFLGDAREEAAGVLKEITGSGVRVVALGCLVERVAGCPELERFLERADARIGFGDYPRLAEICRDVIDRRSPSVGQGALVWPEYLQRPRLRIGGRHTAYLKLGEGCSNTCRFCSVPLIRGSQVSRPIEHLVEEAELLWNDGSREINLIAQDTTNYGRDLYRRPRLADLLRALAGLPVAAWFRLLYACPGHLDGEILDALAEDERFCRYLDIPLQHIADPVLKAMGRPLDRRATVELLDLVERKLPGCALRTTFIVGYPGETEADFSELLAFVREGRFTHAGVFTYSREPGTAAAELADNVPPEEKERRRSELLLAQQAVSRARLAKEVGGEVEVLVEGRARGPDVPRGATLVGRSRGQAPEIDGVVFLRGPLPRHIEPGEFVWARVVGSMDYDLIAEVI